MTLFPTAEQERQMCDAVRDARDSILIDELCVDRLCCHVEALLDEHKKMRETIDVVQNQKIDAAVEGSDWKARAMRCYSEYGETPAQYHAGLDKLWKALGLSGVQEEDVFTLSAKAIGERDRLKKELEDTIEDVAKMESSHQDYLREVEKWAHDAGFEAGNTGIWT